MTQDYIHGYSPLEQHRLVEQADVLAPVLYRDLDLASSRELLEIGCGVGAELAHIRQLWAGAALTGLDRSGGHLSAAADYLAGITSCGDVRLVQGDGCALPFADASFDTVITIWMLEHVPDPERVLHQALRVLEEDGRLICTEVDNDTFAFEPDLPLISSWWRRFNASQRAAEGDPWIGRRLASLAQRLGCRDIGTCNLPVVSSLFDPGRRSSLVDYIESLLLSGAEYLLESGEARQAEIPALRDAFQQVREDTRIELRYFAVRLCCRRPYGDPVGRQGLR